MNTRALKILAVSLGLCAAAGNLVAQVTLTNLHSFSGNPSDIDGYYPEAGLVQGRDGFFYGTTSVGGTNSIYDEGTVFRISPNGSYTTLFTFGSTNFPNDGYYPEAGLVQGSDGNFYGTTVSGGTNDYGTMFQLNTNGDLTVLHSFVFGGEINPRAGLIQGKDGNFYGTTSAGGSRVGSGGTVFRISPGGSYSNLYSFFGTSDGSNPRAGLVQGSDGNFYGTTYGGTNGGLGTVFRVTTNGSETILYSFSGTDGNGPEAGLVQGSDGNFYGTTLQGGTNNGCLYGCGTVFKLTVPLNPPANQISAIQIKSTNVLVTIPSVAYETYQLQFSSSMKPTNWVNQGGSVSNSIGALLTVTNFGGALLPQGFYRFAITP